MNLILPPLLLQFAATTALAFVLGLELHSYRRPQEEGVGFGTARTLTLIGAVGFVLWLLDGAQPRGLYLAGLAALAVWLSIDLARTGSAGGTGGELLPGMIALLAYVLGPLVQTQPAWMPTAMLIVAILMLAEKPLIRKISDALPTCEGGHAGQIPDHRRAGVATAARHADPGSEHHKLHQGLTGGGGHLGDLYTGYLVHTYLLPRASTLLIGLLGGIYSSTATTVVLAR
ncbi:MAG: hypothetical protein ACP5RC_01485 [Halothiobacillaceae bacterium]